MTRQELLDLVARPGAALLDGWSDGGRWTIALPEPVEEFHVGWNELGRLDAFLEERAGDRLVDMDPGLPFAGGWVGFIAYETGAAWEGAEPRADIGVPAALFYRHEKVLAIDLSGGFRRPVVAGRGSFASESDGLSEGRRTEFPAERERNIGARPSPPGRATIHDSLAGDSYVLAHEAIRQGIALGDFYQVNLTRRFRTDLRKARDAGDLFRELAGDPPPPYSVLMRGAAFDILSASPELFLCANYSSREIEMRPIKGTAARYDDPGEDRASADRLLASTKDHAENVMIVDLCRNDLGRVCDSGSVSVSEICRLTSHRVHHLESVIRGRLRQGATPRQVLRATFPPGSVTGAPKRAAVNAIRRLEPVPRGVYTGAIGFFDRRGRMAFNVAIRTAELRGTQIEYHAGGGITWGSDAASEDFESRLKAREFFDMIADDVED